MNDDLISRQAAITLPIMPKEYRKHKPIDCDDAYEQGWSDCQSCIGRLPTAEKKGKWKHRKNWSMYVCDQCSFESREASRYCSNCGARMTEESDETY